MAQRDLTQAPSSKATQHKPAVAPPATQAAAVKGSLKGLNFEQGRRALSPDGDRPAQAQQAAPPPPAAAQGKKGKAWYQHVGDFGKGLYLGGKDTVTGLATLGKGAWNLTGGWLTNPEAARGSWETTKGVASAVVNDPGKVWDAVKQPYVEAWQQGRPGEAIGRGTFEVITALVGTKGADKLAKGSKVAKLANKADDVGRLANKADDVGRLANKVDDVGKVTNKADDVGKVLNKADDVGGVAKKGNGLQSTADIEVLYQQAAVAQKDLASGVGDIAARTGGKPMIPTALKGRERALEKVAAEYGGDASNLTDLARASIEYEKMDDLTKGLAELQKRFPSVRVKDRFAKPTEAGYRDILVNVKAPNGHVCEVQLHLKQILEVKGGAGHKIYEEVRTIQANAAKAGRSLTPEELKRVATLQAQSRELYDAAFRSAGGAAR
jgi:hypothetical protein